MAETSHKRSDLETDTITDSDGQQVSLVALVSVQADPVHYLGRCLGGSGEQYTAPFTGGLVGFFAGFALIPTARLAAAKQSWGETEL